MKLVTESENFLKMGQAKYVIALVALSFYINVYDYFTQKGKKKCVWLYFGKQQKYFTKEIYLYI